MTYKEAIDYFKRRKTQYGLADNVQQAENCAIEALKKQTPKKALDMTFSWAVCPVCGGSIYLESIKEYMLDGVNTYCEHCGQKIDWSDTE